MNHPRDLFLLMRPRQWIKNGFVLIGVLFAPESLLSTEIILKVFLAALAFCLASSCVYIINDIFDLPQDLAHPKKKFRPLPAKKVSIAFAAAMAILLGIISILLAYSASFRVVAILMGYIGINAAYTYYLKQIVILDVFCISAGFMLRIMAGTYGVGIPPSKWLLLCSMMLTLFLGFAKRRAEIIASRYKEESRQVLENYGPILLDELISICIAGVIITYSLYTMSEETISIHKTENLIYTVPFVIYALFRYIFLLNHRHGGEDPSQEIVKDPHIIASVVGWGCLTFLFLS